MKSFTIAAISGYQRFVSPYKGYCCAHKSFHGGYSCSEFAKQTIIEFGVWHALKKVKARLLDCRYAYAMLQVSKEKSGTDKKGEGDNSGGCGDTAANICSMPCL